MCADSRDTLAYDLSGYIISRNICKSRLCTTIINSIRKGRLREFSSIDTLDLDVIRYIYESMATFFQSV